MHAAVLYHDNCPDGWTAAWVAHRALTEQGADVDMHPVAHSYPPPELGHEVDTAYLVDFAYPHDTLVKMADTRRVVVLDHHQSAINDIVAGIGGTDHLADSVVTCTIPAGPYEVVLDTNRSGAGIAWDYFNTGRPRPAVVDYVEDRDLWRFNLPDSKAVSAYIRCQPYTLDTWDCIAAQDVAQMATSGYGILVHIDAYCRRSADCAYMATMGDRTFPIVNVPYESCSEVAAHLLDHFAVDMAGYFFERADGRWQYGFRSRNGVTVHDHAAQFGGGGHPQASGCTVEKIIHERT